MLLYSKDYRLTSKEVGDAIARPRTKGVDNFFLHMCIARLTS